jgi:hypothetical protein
MWGSLRQRGEPSRRLPAHELIVRPLADIVCGVIFAAASAHVSHSRNNS